MPKTLKVNTVLLLLLSDTFFVFFDRTKHLPALAEMLPFGNDPYDAVGSFGIQLAFLGALLSVLRAFRPYDDPPGQEQVGLLLRSQIVIILTVVVTLAADLVAMLRYTPAWLDTAGLLIPLVAGMTLLNALAGWRVMRSIRSIGGREQVGPRPWSWIIVLASLLILAFYPDGWRENVAGGILTAAVGMALLFLQTRALAAVLIPAPVERYEDILDDLAAVYRRSRPRGGLAACLVGFFERLANTGPAREISGLLNPRKHAWSLALLVGMAAGSALALAEALGEGISPNSGMVVLVMGIFTGMECAAILLGYALFAGYLGMFRKGA